MTLRERRLDPETLAQGQARACRSTSSSATPIPSTTSLQRLTPLVDAYQAAGLDVTLKVYPGGRHEMLNETNRDEVVADLRAWLDRTVAAMRLQRSLVLALVLIVAAAAVGGWACRMLPGDAQIAVHFNATASRTASRRRARAWR